MTTAVFDLDGTLYDGHITRGLALHHNAHGVKRFDLALFLATHIPIWWLTRAGIISDEKMRATWAQDIPWLVKGWTQDEGERAFDWIANEYIEPRFKIDIVARLKSHQDRGHRVILLSGTPTPMLAAIGRLLGVPDVVGTPIVVNNGRYTGRSERPVCQGRDKVLRLGEYLSNTEREDLGKSYAYADSFGDRFILQVAGHPVAVDPDQKLLALAKQHKWEIFKTSAEPFLKISGDS
jgi:HAD superfamily hydrolase (TIGR01490 family)